MIKERENKMSNKTTYKIVIHNPDKVDMNDDILNGIWMTNDYM